jgi:hypothetical protein
MTSRMGRLVAIIAVFLAVALLPIPVWVAVLDVAVFGSFLLLGLANPISRRVAFRVDTRGVTLGGVFPRFRASTAFIPWHDVIELRLFELPLGRPPTPYIQVVRREGAPELPRGMGFGRSNQWLMGGEFAACRNVVSWTLDEERLLTVLSNVAPDVALNGTLVRPPREPGSRRLRTRRDRRLRFLWCYLAPIAIVGALWAGAANVGPAWSAHLGHGIVGTWTVEPSNCAGRNGCEPFGRFVSADGTDVRDLIQMAPGSPPIPGVGGQLPAIDTGGDHVYPIGGGYLWWIMSLIIGVAAALLGLWTWTVLVPPIGRLSSRIRWPA